MKLQNSPKGRDGAEGNCLDAYEHSAEIERWYFLFQT